MSFNEIDFSAGLEIAELFAKLSTLKLLDLNGNKFGEEGKQEIRSVLAPIGNSLGSLRF